MRQFPTEADRLRHISRVKYGQCVSFWHHLVLFDAELTYQRPQTSSVGGLNPWCDRTHHEFISDTSLTDIAEYFNYLPFWQFPQSCVSGPEGQMLSQILWFSSCRIINISILKSIEMLRQSVSSSLGLCGELIVLRHLGSFCWSLDIFNVLLALHTQTTF